MKLVEIDNKNVALDLVEYLKYNNIQVTLTEEKSLFIIYINNSDQLFKAKSLIINYQKQKSSNNISDFTSKTNSLVRVIKDNPCTSLFVFISIVFYFIYLVSSNFYSYLYFDLNLIINDFQVWRLVTPIFMHFSFAHIAFNMSIFAYMGCRIENYRGLVGFLGIIAFTGIFSNMSQFFHNELQGNFGGMSGVCYGIMAYMFTSFNLTKKPETYFIAKSMFPVLMLIAVIMALFLDGIAHTAHFVGAACGVIYSIFEVKILKILK
jgi:GlpG protein